MRNAVEPISESSKSREAKSIGRRRWARRSATVFFGVPIFYVVCAIVGLIPVNQDFVPTENGVSIFVYSGSVHSDIIVPVGNSVINWREIFPDDQLTANLRHATHVSIGWGDRGFYLDTPEWKDLTASTAAKAILIPSRTVMHVQYERHPRTNAERKSVTISNEQYQKLVEYILRSFDRDEHGEFRRIEFAYGKDDAFYEARGSYHAFRTCNCWVSDGLQHAKIKTAWFTPFPRTVLWYLPDANL